MKTITGKILALLIVLTFSVIMAPGTLAAGDPDTSSPENTQIIKQVRKELVTLPYYGVFDNLEYKVSGNTVTLYGQVVRPGTRSDAENRVARIPGVAQVVDRIEVLPLSPFDDSIRVRTYRTLFSTAGLYRYAMGANPSIHIIVDNGHITLEGTVSNKMDSQLAYMEASRVPGAFSVTNHLEVEKGQTK